MMNEKDIERQVRKLEPPPGWHPGVRLFIHLFIALVGFIVLLVGIALLVLPGPAFIVIPAGLAILASQFRWARDLLHLVMSVYRGIANIIKPLWRRLTGAEKRRARRDGRYVIINRRD